MHILIGTDDGRGFTMNAIQRWGWFLLLAIGAAGIADAAGFVVKDVRLGMTQEDVRAQFGDKIQCSPRAASETDPSQVTCVSAAFAKYKTLSDTFAGHKTVIRYHLLDGHVARISFLGFPSLAFDSIVRSMQPMYGDATVASQTVQVSMKAKLVNKRATWRNDAGEVIIFDKYSPGNLNRSFLNFYGDSYPKNMRPGS